MSYLLSLVNENPSLSQNLERATPETAGFLCYHVNYSRVIQVIRVMDQDNCLFERIVFPMERILFIAVPGVYLEVYESVVDGTISERIDCESLRVS